MNFLLWTIFIVGVVGIPVGIVLFAVTANPIALIDTVWAGGLAYAAWSIGH